jgi:topoisomerase-4 subunit A
MSKKVKEETPIKENISIEPLDGLMGDRYAIYAKYVIQDRAIPDVRDGLKPVQRRIIYSMRNSGNTFDKPTRKCAKIVGDVMGRFHPHGDSSIYDALVRLSQSWKMSAPLIQFQGNNGSIDNDPPAAYRYTEAKLNEFSEFLIEDIDENTVDMTLNFDDTELEPVVLPARFPNLFVNGSEGIAVALATEIPPHNLKEIGDAVVYRIENPNCTLDDLLTIVKGPDFPTGGQIYESDGIRDIYATGRGKIDLASKVDIVEGDDENELVITEIPYGVIKQSLVYSIDKIRKARDIDGILDVKDLSAGEDIKIVVALKKEIDPHVVLTYLMNKTQLKISYSSNIVAICEDHPRLLNLIDYLDEYIRFQVQVITRRSQFELDRANKRKNIVEGLVKAINVIDEVVKIIRGSKDKGDAKANLTKAFGFDDDQAESIVTMRLYKLTNTDVNVYLTELEGLKKDIAYLDSLLHSPSKLRKVIVKDLNAISEKYSTPRRTAIVKETPEVSIDKRDLIIKEDVEVAITKDGYIKRSSLKSYKSSNNELAGHKNGDVIVMSQEASTLDFVLCFTNRGNYIFLPVHEIVEGKWKDEGKHVNYICNLPLEEMIVKCVLVKDFTKKVFITQISRRGQIKRSKLSDFLVQRYSRPINCMRLLSDDEVVDVALSHGDSDLFAITMSGIGTYFNENEVAITGLKSSGVKAFGSLHGSEVAALLTYNREERSKILFLTDKGMYRIYDSSSLIETARLGKSQTIFRSFKSDVHSLIYMSKLVNKVGMVEYTVLDDSGAEEKLVVSDFHATPIEKYCKKNLDLEDGKKIVSVFTYEVETVDKDTVEETPKIAPNDSGEGEGGSDENDDGYEQISIFDDLGD